MLTTAERRQEAVAYLQARLVNEATDDPQELRVAQEELDEMKRSMNAERLRSGAGPIFPLASHEDDFCGIPISPSNQ